MYFAGFGCRRGCSETSLRELMEQALSAQGFRVEQLSGLASVDRKNDEEGLRALAQRMNLPLMFFSPEQLAACADRAGDKSEFALAAVGAASVAEASALALAERRSGQRAELIIRKHKNTDATFALARVWPSIDAREQQ